MSRCAGLPSGHLRAIVQGTKPWRATSVRDGSGGREPKRPGPPSLRADKHYAIGRHHPRFLRRASPRITPSAARTAEPGAAASMAMDRRSAPSHGMRSLFIGVGLRRNRTPANVACEMRRSIALHAIGQGSPDSSPHGHTYRTYRLRNRPACRASPRSPSRTPLRRPQSRKLLSHLHRELLILGPCAHGHLILPCASHGHLSRRIRCT